MVEVRNESSRSILWFGSVALAGILLTAIAVASMFAGLIIILPVLFVAVVVALGVLPWGMALPWGRRRAAPAEPAAETDAIVEGPAQLAVTPDELREVDILRGLTAADLAAVAAIAERRRFQEATRVAAQGEWSRSLYIILDGQIELTVESAQGALTVRVAETGESLPLAALIGSGQLISTAVTMTEVDAAVLDRDAFVGLCLERPQIGMHVFRNIADILGSRYEQTLDRLVDTLETRMNARRRQDLFANV